MKKLIAALIFTTAAAAQAGELRKYTYSQECNQAEENVRSAAGTQSRLGGTYEYKDYILTFDCYGVRAGSLLGKKAGPSLLIETRNEYHDRLEAEARSARQQRENEKIAATKFVEQLIGK